MEKEEEEIARDVKMMSVRKAGAGVCERGRVMRPVCIGKGKG